tara:strand:- start:3925 stop:4782 length:858 start_codon:yes stop_codon:yes gene_type:complete
MCDKVSEQVYTTFEEMEGNLIKGIRDTIKEEVLPDDFAKKMVVLNEYALPIDKWRESVIVDDKYEWKSKHKPDTKYTSGTTTMSEPIQSIKNAIENRHLTFKNGDPRGFDIDCDRNANAVSSKIIRTEQSDLDKLKKYYNTYLTSYKSMHNYQLSLGALIDGKQKELNKFSNKMDTYKQNLYIDGRKDTYENSNYDFYKSINYYLLIVYGVLLLAYLIFTPFFQEEKYKNLGLVSIIIVYIMIPFILPSLLALIYMGYEYIIEHNNMKDDIISYPHIIEDEDKYS